MKVKDAMSSKVACAERSTPLQEVARMMVDCDCGEIPVVDKDDRIVGVVTDRDITCRTVARGRNPLELAAQDAMTSPAITIVVEATLDACCQVMESNQVRRVPVVDRLERCIGIVSQADVARLAPKRSTAEVVQRVSQPSKGASVAAP